MGKLRNILCVAANKESLFVAGYTGDEKSDLVLVKSDAYPASLASAKWELLATLPFKETNGKYFAYPESTECAAGDDGSFLLLLGLKQFHALSYDPLAPNRWFENQTSRYCPDDAWCSGVLLQIPGTSPSQFNYIYQAIFNDPPANSTVDFKIYNPSLKLFDTKPRNITLEDSKYGSTFAYYNNQMVYLSSLKPSSNATSSYNTTSIVHTDEELSPQPPLNATFNLNATSTIQSFDIDDKHLPIQRRQAPNVPLPYDDICGYSSLDPLNGVGNDGRWYIFCNTYYGKKPGVAFAFDGQTVTKLGQFRPANDEMAIFGSFSMIPVPSQGAPTWTVALSRHGENWSKYGLFGLNISKDSFGLWESSEAVALSVDGLGLSGGAIAGIVIGTLVAVAGIACGFYFRRRKKNQTQKMGA